jgi:two-component system nitrogen regulation response regulator GlnG
MIDHGLFYEEAIAEFEKKFIATVLNKNRGNQTKAAKAMGIHRNTLRNKIGKLRLT